jgi:hypothetical protein
VPGRVWDALLALAIALLAVIEGWALLVFLW